MSIRKPKLQRTLLVSIVYGALLNGVVTGCSERTFEPAARPYQQNIAPTSALYNKDSDITASIEDPLDSGGAGNVNGRTVRANFTRMLNKENVVREIFYLNGVENNYVDFVYDAGKLVKRVWYTAAGTDAIWFNADDVISAYTDFAPTTANINSIRYTGAGTDAQWFTNDDLVEHYDANLLDTAGTVIGEASYTQSGTDGTWFTADDVLSTLEVITETAQGDHTWVRYTTPGADADWTTLADNVTTDFRLVKRNVTAQPLQIVDFRGVGADGEVFTADDVVGSYRDFTYDAQNEVTQSIYYGGGPNANGAGADGKWFTGDDLIRNCRALERDPAGLPFRTITTRPGVDVACFTADDVIRGYHQDDFDATGVVTRSVTYNMPGVDTKWFTADDVIHNEELFTIP